MMAAVTVAGIGSISANAATPVYKYNTSYGTLTGSITVSSSTAKTITFKTTTTSEAYKLVMSGDVDNYSTGELIKGVGPSTKYNSSTYSGGVSWPFYIGLQVSAFGAHEARTESGSAWVVYTSKSGFYI